MNPLTLNFRKARLELEIRKVIHAWPTGKVFRAHDGLSAVVLVRAADAVTYTVEVTAPERGEREVQTRSLWVKHAGLGAMTPEWRAGWDD